MPLRNPSRGRPSRLDDFKMTSISELLPTARKLTYELQTQVRQVRGALWCMLFLVLVIAVAVPQRV